jgi:hypothetical protein
MVIVAGSEVMYTSDGFRSLMLRPFTLTEDIRWESGDFSTINPDGTCTFPSM